MELIGRGSKDDNDYRGQDRRADGVEHEMPYPQSYRIAKTVRQLHGLYGRPSFSRHIKGKERGEDRLFNTLLDYEKQRINSTHHHGTEEHYPFE